MGKTRVLQEKRGCRRYKLDYCFDIYWDDLKIRSQIKDISCGGVFCRSDQLIPLKTKVEVRMDIPLLVNSRKIEKTIKCSAEVARIDPLVGLEKAKYDLGVNFSDVSEENKALILKFVRQRNLNEAKGS